MKQLCGEGSKCHLRRKVCYLFQVNYFSHYSAALHSQLDTQKTASICKKTSSHWVRLGVNYWLEIQEEDCDPSRQDISTCRSVSVIRDPLWHVMVENQSQVCLLPSAGQWGLRSTDDLWLCHLKMHKLSPVKSRPLVPSQWWDQCLFYGI